MISVKTVSELRKELNKSKSRIVILGGDDKINRAAVESKKTFLLVSPERFVNKDYMHSRNSGLNQVLCKLASRNNVAIGFDFCLVYNSKNRGLVLGRMMQNVRLCR